ncbi:hypothetical protein [Pseudomonas sp.]|uniref:hypothetical protein n=1 Tax=Pseudomonas sp. TaxID=306 RepID=UPI003A96E968
MAKPKHQLRVAPMTFEEDATSRLFIDPSDAKLTDLSKVRILRCGVDTVRQHYRGVLRPEILPMFEEPGYVEFAGEIWHKGRVGRDSGYQYKLQNADLGIILLIKNFNAKPDSVGPHLKIEVSPHAIEARDHGELQKLMDTFATAVLNVMEKNQCAVHLALDVQGWTPPDDIAAKLHCRARTQRSINGINEVSWATKCSTYGRGETAMFGSASGLQLCIYNKTEQARATDKLDYWESVWRSSDNPFEADPEYDYNPGQDVTRIELRYHHSIVQQFTLGSLNVHTGEVIGGHTYAALVPHLDGLWRYGCEAFRLLDRPGCYNPFWTLISQDVRVSVPVASLVEHTTYKRHHKTANGFSGKNVDLFIGNMVSLLARERVGAKKAFASLQEWECWPVIRDHYAAKGKTEYGIYQHIRELLKERTIRWGVAV